MESAAVYIPIDRRLALIKGESVPDRDTGATLFADISGFTPLTEALVRELGRQEGAEELTRQLNLVYDALIDEVHRYRGSVIGFSGDAITCWFAGDSGLHATACALAIQQAMQQFAAIKTPSGDTSSLTVHVAVAAGSVRRFLVGDPRIQYIDVLAGTTLDRMAAAEKYANKGEVVIDPQTAATLGNQVTVTEWRSENGGDQAFAVVGEIPAPVAVEPWPNLPGLALVPNDVCVLCEDSVRPWLLPPVYERLASKGGHFLAEIRPAVSLFLRFSGIDYDGDEQAGAKLNAYIQWVQNVLARYEGFLIQLTIGDKGSYLYSVFGAPLAHDNDPVRAVTAAQELLAPPPQFHYISPPQIGISRGQMRTGAYGSSTTRTYGVLGDEVNLAARLMSKSEPGNILVSQPIFEAVGRHYQLQSLGSIPLKGKRDPIPVWCVHGRKQVSLRRVLPRFQNEHSLEHEMAGLADTQHAPTRLVGRFLEVTCLVTALDSLREGEGHVVIIEGEAGMGKSRLVTELARLVRQHRLTGLMGAGQSIEQHTPYRAWRDILCAYFDVESVTDMDRYQEPIRRMVAQVAPEHLPRLPLLNEVLGINLPDTPLTRSLDPARRKHNLSTLVLALLRAWTKEQPLVLVLEDAHWLDSLSWELVVQVVRTMVLEGEPILLVLVMRPLDANTLAARHVSMLRSLENTEAMTLQGLSSEETIQLVTARLGLADGGLPAPLANLVRRQVEGNPFFAEELVFTLRDQGIIKLEPDGQHYRCTINGDLDRVSRTLPDNVQGLILARIDRLPPDRQMVLKVGSVIGRSFPYTALSSALQQHSPLEDDALKEHLHALATLDMTPLETPEPDLSYHFKHIITQEVVYQTLLFVQRRALHRTVAHWYETTFGDREETDEQPRTTDAMLFDILHIRSKKNKNRRKTKNAKLAPFYPLLVHHYRQAADRGNELLYARLAGEQAVEHFANDEALTYLSRALELTRETEMSERYALLLAREKVYDLQGDRVAQRRDLKELEGLAEKLNDNRRRAEVALRCANYAESTADYTAAIAASVEAIQLAWSEHQVCLRAAGHLQLGQAYLRLGDYVSAREQSERALAQARAAQDAAVEIDSLRNLGSVTMMQHAYQDAENWYRQSLRLSQETGDRMREAKARIFLGLALLNHGNYSTARNHLLTARSLCRDIGDRREEGSSLGHLGTVDLQCGLYESAQSLYDQALQIHHDVHNRLGELVVLSHLGLLYHLLGNNTAALDYSEQALHLSVEIKSLWQQGFALTNVGHALAGLGRLPEAAHAYQQAYDLRTRTNRTGETVEPLAGLAMTTLRQGKPDQASAAVEQILSYLDEESLVGLNEPLRVYLTCYTVLHTLHDPRAEGVLHRASALLHEQAARIEDPSMRQSFLERVATHRTIVQLSTALLV